MLIALHNAAAERALDAATQRVQSEIALVNVYVALFNAKQAARSVKIQIFEAQLRAALAPLEAAKLAIEAEALKGQINEQAIRAYAAQLDAVKNLVEIYRADISAAQAQAEIEKTKADIFRTEVQAWAERIGARKVEFDAYDTYLYPTVKNPNIDATGDFMSGSDKELEKVLRPQGFFEFSGQERIIENLKVFIAAAKHRGEALDHVLLHGPPGLGKTTLSCIIANELGVNMKITSGPVLEKPGDLAGLLTSLEERDVLFIDADPSIIYRGGRISLSGHGGF